MNLSNRSDLIVSIESHRYEPLTSPIAGGPDGAAPSRHPARHRRGGLVHGRRRRARDRPVERLRAGPPARGRARRASCSSGAARGADADRVRGGGARAGPPHPARARGDARRPRRCCRASRSATPASASSAPRAAGSCPRSSPTSAAARRASSCASTRARRSGCSPRCSSGELAQAVVTEPVTRPRASSSEHLLDEALVGLVPAGHRRSPAAPVPLEALAELRARPAARREPAAPRGRRRPRRADGRRRCTVPVEVEGIRLIADLVAAGARRVGAAGDGGAARARAACARSRSPTSRRAGSRSISIPRGRRRCPLGATARCATTVLQIGRPTPPSARLARSPAARTRRRATTEQVSRR